jgi:hypothetical protein
MRILESEVRCQEKLPFSHRIFPSGMQGKRGKRKNKKILSSTELYGSHFPLKGLRVSALTI